MAWNSDKTIGGATTSGAEWNTMVGVITTSANLVSTGGTIGGAVTVSGSVTTPNVLEGYTTTATAAGTTTLTSSSTYMQYFTGTNTQTVVLPVTSTLVLGQQFVIVNNSTLAVTVQSSGANNILIVGGNTTGTFTCILTSGTSAASWNAQSTQNIVKRTVTVTQSATPAINTDNIDIAKITGLAQAITSMTSSLTGTPVDGQMLMIQITDNGTARAITWGASFEASTVALPTTTVISTRLDSLFIYNSTTSKWRCMAVA